MGINNIQFQKGLSMILLAMEKIPKEHRMELDKCGLTLQVIFCPVGNRMKWA